LAKHEPLKGPRKSTRAGHKIDRREPSSKKSQKGRRREAEPYSGASHTVSSWQFKKWLGVMVQPRTREL
jgi:hypothetical protein